MSKQHKNPWYFAAVFSSISLQMIVLTILGAWLGKKLDALFQTHPAFVLMGTILGMIVGFVSAYITLSTQFKD